MTQMESARARNQSCQASRPLHTSSLGLLLFPRLALVCEGSTEETAVSFFLP